MTRVSENSSSASVQYAINKAKERLEELQMKGSTMKDMRRPSDNPVGNVEALAISSTTSDNEQYLKNSEFALIQLGSTEKALEQLGEILVSAKEIAISQASDIYNSSVRKNVANNVIQLRNQVLAIANKRVGNRYIFAGHSTLQPPFDVYGGYKGDLGQINLEIAKDFFVPINLNGREIFYTESDSPDPKDNNALKDFPEIDKEHQNNNHDPVRDLASVENAEGFVKKENIFNQLSTLISALENNDTTLIQNLLEKFDDSVSRLITLRTKVGSITKSIASAQEQINVENVGHAERRSKLVDADIAELFSNLTKQQQVLKTTYQAGSNLMSKTLLDFIK